MGGNVQKKYKYIEVQMDLQLLTEKNDWLHDSVGSQNVLETCDAMWTNLSICEGNLTLAICHTLIERV